MQREHGAHFMQMRAVFNWNNRRRDAFTASARDVVMHRRLQAHMMGIRALRLVECRTAILMPTSR